ncbi:MAG TPA: hypothetical protein VGJ70_21540, partial [Solirubrobacteraceae bacterium]
DTVARATAKDPAERYPTAGDLATAVRRAVAEQEAERQREAAQPTELAASEPSPVPAAAAPAESAPAASAGGGRPRRRRVPAIAALALVCAAAVVAAILLSTSSDSPSSTTAASSESAGERATSDLGPVPYSKVQGTGEAVVQLDGDIATVSVKANGLLNAQHAMHFHAGTRGVCPPPRAARDHGGHLAIATSDGVPWYGPPVTALTTSGDTSPKKSLLAFTRFPSAGRIDYHRRFPLRPVVASYIRHKNAVVIVHGIDYNHNGIYDFSALDRSELKRSLAAETTAPALCGALVPAGKKTGQVGGGPKIYTASLHLVDASAPESPGGALRWLCPLVLATRDQRTRA